MHKQLRGLGRAVAPVAVATAITLVATLSPPGATASLAPTSPSAPAAPATAAGDRAGGSVTAARDGADTQRVAARKKRKRKRYTPRTGVIVTSPLHKSKGRIMNHILRSIRGTRKGHEIRIISWNVVSRRFVGTLINAHKRGVSVRLLMSRQKAEGQSKRGSFWRLKRALRKKNGQPRAKRSWARGCARSCRGRRGIAHSKLFLFSKVGRADNVVMSTSANATEVSVDRQWNDLYTNVGSKAIYDGFDRIFRESARDKPVRHAYRTFRRGTVTGYVYPFRGRAASGDRVKSELRRIRCKGARGGTGVRGRTRIRIAQDAIINKRGINIAYQLRRKYQQGCNIRIVYALMGREVRRILKHTRRGPVPMRQIVQDWDGDWVYDRYLHAKVMAVSGRYRRDRSARVAWQGSENWSGLATISDEQGFQIRRGGAEGVYARWVDWLFNNPPPRPNLVAPARTAQLARARGIDPYALMKEELGLSESWQP